jgi:hypothetical protein
MKIRTHLRTHLRTHSRRLSLALLVALSTCAVAAGNATAADLQALDDAALSDVQGRDGVGFLLNLNVNIGSTVLGVTDTDANPATIAMSNVALTGLIAATWKVSRGEAGAPDFVNISLPALNGTNTMQYAYDLGIVANGRTLGTSIMFENMSFGGSSTQWTTAANGGAAFGLGLNMGVENIYLRPNGRASSVGQMSASGVKLTGVGEAGVLTPWVIADVANQPGFFKVGLDDSGNSQFQLGIGWPDVKKDAPAGSLQIDNISFATPTGNVNLGSSSIASMQLQYLSVKFK